LAPDVHRRDLGGAEAILQKHGVPGELVLRAKRGHDDRVQILGAQLCRLNRAHRGLVAEIGECGPLVRPAAFDHPRSLLNPLVARVHLLRQVVVRHHPGRNVHSGPNDPGPPKSVHR
jgi:hypothetical protein